MADYTTVTDFSVAFEEHPLYPDAHKHMNCIYGDYLGDLDRLFTDNQRTEVILHNEVDALVRRIIVDEIIAPVPTQTVGGANHICPLIQNAAITLWNGHTCH